MSDQKEDSQNDSEPEDTYNCCRDHENAMKVMALEMELGELKMLISNIVLTSMMYIWHKDEENYSAEEFLEYMKDNGTEIPKEFM